MQTTKSSSRIFYSFFKTTFENLFSSKFFEYNRGLLYNKSFDKLKMYIFSWSKKHVKLIV